jgi:hypothetical protein
MRHKAWRKWWLTYFDWNGDGVINWWEFIIPFGIVIGIEILAELVVKLILG